MDFFETDFTKQNSIKTLGLSEKRKFDMHENAYMPIFTHTHTQKTSCHISVIYTENTEPWKNSGHVFYITHLISELIAKVPKRMRD